MKKLFALLFVFVGLTAFAQSVIYVLVPEKQPVTFAWEHAREDGASEYYVLHVNGQKVEDYTDGEFTIIETKTNTTGEVLSTVTAKYPPGFVKGTNTVFVKAINVLGMESNPSNVLPLRALGKPAPPQNNRKF